MKISTLVLTAALAGEAFASWGFGKSAYNKWHETELERWLSDHNIPYPKPADRKDLEKIVQDNWQTKVVDSYNDWDAPQLQSYLSDTGKELDKKQKENKNWLVENVKKGWHETEKTAETAYGSVKDWIFDSWTESQLKSFLDRHGIPCPQPRTRDTYLSTARSNYQSVANKLGETSAYPGNWLYESWSDSDLKKWLDERGYKVPNRTPRDQLIATVRRNSRLASVRGQYYADSVKNTVSDTIFDTWSESSLKEFLDKNGVKIPQGSKKNELLALARRNKAYYTGDNLSASAASSFDSATSYAGEKASEATDAASYYSQVGFDKLIESWSDTRLKSYLDSRGVPVPQNGKRDELLAKVRLNAYKASTGFGAWTFDTWTYDNLKNWLEARGQDVSASGAATRDELYSSAQVYYSNAAASASSAASVASKSGTSAGSKATDSAASAANVAGQSAASAAKVAGSSAASAASVVGESVTSYAGEKASQATDAATDAAGVAYASITSALAQATDAAKETTFDTWSDSDLKAYLDTYGISTYQGTTRNQLIAAARRNSHAFIHGSGDQGVSGQAGTAFSYLWGKFGELMGWGAKQAQKGGNRAYESAQVAGDAAKEKAQQAYDRAREEL
ncbi:hypothetical protein EDC01DRAFT_749219 [Geopyxis carbonaria]|nr:hypothetical protein EDC01DRAFT_749219 [Geopyxis carbonaria]